jgi:hypothetical protein
MQTTEVIMPKMDSLLAHWINSHNHHNINLGFLIILEDVVSLKTQEDGTSSAEDLEFKEHHGWFETAKTSANLHV